MCYTCASILWYLLQGTKSRRLANSQIVSRQSLHQPAMASNKLPFGLSFMNETSTLSPKFWIMRGGESSQNEGKRRKKRRKRHRHREKQSEESFEKGEEGGSLPMDSEFTASRSGPAEMKGLNQSDERNAETDKEGWGFYDPKEDEPYFLHDWLCEKERYGRPPEEYGDDSEVDKYFHVTPETEYFRKVFAEQESHHCVECNRTVGVLMAYNFSTCFACFSRMAEEENWFFERREYPWQDVKEWLIYKKRYKFEDGEPDGPTNVTEYNRMQEAMELEQVSREMKVEELEEKTGVKLKSNKIDPAAHEFDKIPHFGFGRMNPKEMMDELESDCDDCDDEGSELDLAEPWASL